jgi:hypothetical protein
MLLNSMPPGPGAGLETPIFGSEEPGLRPGLRTSSCNRGSGLQTLNLGFEEEEEEEEGWDLVREPQAHRQTDRIALFAFIYIKDISFRV